MEADIFECNSPLRISKPKDRSKDASKKTKNKIEGVVEPSFEKIENIITVETVHVDDLTSNELKNEPQIFQCPAPRSLTIDGIKHAKTPRLKNDLKLHGISDDLTKDNLRQKREDLIHHYTLFHSN